MCPTAYCLAMRIRRAVSATVSLTAPMPGGQGLPGLAVQLINAAQAKNVPGRPKTSWTRSGWPG